MNKVQKLVAKSYGPTPNMHKQTLKRGKFTEVIDLKCYFCLRKCYDKWTLCNHILSQHTLEHRFLCDLCPYGTVTISQLREHKRSLHMVKGFWRKYSSNCDLCGKYFQSRESLLWHRKTVHKIASAYSCYFCPKKLQGLLSLHQHILSKHTRERPFTCKKCPYETVCPNILKKHEDNHIASAAGTKMPFICIPCGQTFRRIIYLKKHIRIKHQEIRNHFCSVCGKGFFSIADRNNHSTIHSKEKVHSCPMCPKKFRLVGILKIHLSAHHLQEKPHVCYFCCTPFCSTTELIRHLRALHTRERPFVCTVCKKTFGHPSTLYMHLKLHKTNVEKLPCPFCGRLYAGKSGMTVHIQTHHLYEKSHKCVECGETFLLIGQLQRHGQTHHGHPLFKCKYCDQLYTVKSVLTKHIKRVHETVKLESKRVPCYFCLCVRHANSINNHLRARHTKEKPYQCEICKKSYPTPKLTTNECKKHWKIVLANRLKAKSIRLEKDI